MLVKLLKQKNVVQQQFAPVEGAENGALGAHLVLVQVLALEELERGPEFVLEIGENALELQLTLSCVELLSAG